MSAPLDDIEFLARSANRVRVLETIRSESRDRYEVHETTGIPRTTVGRILSDFQERGWVRHDGRQYEITTFGDCLVREFTSLTETVETLHTLRPVLQWLPIEAFDFGLERFADARLFGPGEYNPVAQLDRWIELIRSADRIILMTHAFSFATFEAIHMEVIEHGQEFEAVFTGDLVEQMLADEGFCACSRDILESGRGSFYRYDGTLPCIAANFDDLVGMLVMDEENATRVHIETTDEVIHSWVEETVDTHQHNAEPLDSEMFKA